MYILFIKNAINKIIKNDRNVNKNTIFNICKNILRILPSQGSGSKSTKISIIHKYTIKLFKFEYMNFSS